MLEILNKMNNFLSTLPFVDCKYCSYENNEYLLYYQFIAKYPPPPLYNLNMYPGCLAMICFLKGTRSAILNRVTPF